MAMRGLRAIAFLPACRSASTAEVPPTGKLLIFGWRNRLRPRWVGVPLLAGLLFCMSACGPVLEATRPDPVDVDRFVVGEKRIDIVAELGNPVATLPDAGHSCDIYKLYTRGPGAVGKGVIAAGEAVGDVLTLGLSEVLFTPVEAATRNSKHTVLFCYDANGKLISARESESHLN